MKTRFLPLVIGIVLLGRAAMGNGTVTTVITPAGTVSACYKELEVTLTFNLFDCGDVTLQGIPGTVISFDSGSGFILADVTFNSPHDVTVDSPAGTAKTGWIKFKVALTGCNLYSLPADSGGLRHVQLTTSYFCPALQSSFVDVAVNLPTLQIVLNPSGLSSLNGGNFLMNQVVDRYYAVEVPSGIVDFFTFKIQPEPGIEVLRVDAVNANGGVLFPPLFTGPTTATITLGFGGTGFPIAQYHVGGTAFLDASVGDRIILRERIKITACSVTGEPETVIEAALHCDENTANLACWTDTEQLSVNCLQKGTSLDLSLSDKTTFGAVPGFPSISPCGGTIDYVIFLNNRETSGSSLPAGAGSRVLGTVRIPINGDYFTYNDIWVGNTPLMLGVHYTRSGAGTASDVAVIDFATLTADPDGIGNGLTDVVSSLGVPGRFNLLEEDKHVTIVLEDFAFNSQSQSKLAPCDQSAHPYSLDGLPFLYLKVDYWDMCSINEVNPLPSLLYDAGWQTRNRFSGYCYGLSDNADVAPGTPGHESANLTYTFYSTGQSKIGTTWITPFSISQRPYASGAIADMIKCPDVRYQALIKMPNGFQVTGSQVEVRDPVNPLFGPVILPVTGTYPDLIVDYTGLNGNPLVDGNNVPLAHPAQVSLTFNVELTCGGTVPRFGVASFPLQFRAVCDPSCNPEVYRTMCCSSIDVFFHCPDPCFGAPPVGTKNFDLARTTAGWQSGANFATGMPPNATIHPSLENRFYQCDQVVATSTMGQAGPIPQNGVVAFELAYEPPKPSTGVNGANIFQPESASFAFDDGNGNSFNLPMQSWYLFPDANGLDKLVIIPDVTVLVTVQGVSQTAKLALENGAYGASFTGTFRIVDVNSPTLSPTFHIMHLVFGQFLVVDPTKAAAGIYDAIHQSCDPFAHNGIFLKTESSLERNQLLPPSYNVAYDRQSPVNQCLLRYVVVARTIGGFASGRDFKDLISGASEYRPGIRFPSDIDIQWPSGGYRFDSAAFSEGTGASGAGALAPWTPFVNGVVATATSVKISNIHLPANYPDSISHEKEFGIARQSLMFTLIRECPTEDPDITVEDLVITARAYAPPTACHVGLTPTVPTQIGYVPGTEVHDITMTTVPQTLGNLNPITVPVFLNHFGDGTGVFNAWVYFTVVSGNVLSITPSSSSGSLVGGLYQLGTLLNSPIRQVDVTVDYDCTKLVNGQLVFDPTPIEIMATYGNSCFGYPTLVSGFTGDTNTDFVLPYLPCLAKQETFKILPQKAGLVLVPGAPIPGNCGDVSFNLQAKSTGSDVKGVKMLVTPPTGYVLNPNCSTIEGQSLATILLSHPTLTPVGDVLWDVSDILLTLFGQSTFFFDPQNTQYNPLDFHLCYSLTDCTKPAGPQFEFSMSGISACGEPVAQSLIPVPFSYVPPTVPAATVTATLDPVTDCTNGLRLNIDLTGITYAGNLKATVTATFDSAFGFLASNLAPQNTGAGVIDWVVNPVSSSSLNITADLSIPAKYCKLFPVNITVTLEDVTACCTRTIQYAVAASQLICCSTNCCDVCLPDLTGQYPASYTVTVHPGFNYLANHLCRGTNWIGEILPDVPPGTIPINTTVQKWDHATQTFTSGDTFDGIIWVDTASGNPSLTTLDPGEGFILFNPHATFQLTFHGCEPTCLPPCRPEDGYTLVSRLGTGTPTTYADLFTCPPRCGTHVAIFDPLTQAFSSFDFLNGAWLPQPPTVGVGESIFVTVLANDLCCVPVPSGLLNWWTFDEKAGASAHDIAGVKDNLGNLSPAGSSLPSHVAGKVKNALCFNGVNQWMEVADGNEVDFLGNCFPNANGESFTIDAWIKPNQATGTAMILDKRDSTLRGYALSLVNGFLRVELNTPAVHAYTGTLPLTPNQWHFIAISYERCANILKMYVDGNLTDNIPAPALGVLANGAKLIVGRQQPAHGAPNFYAGCIDELEFFKRILDDDEIHSIWAADSAGKCKPGIHVPPYTLAAASVVASQLTFEWSGDAVLQAAETINGPWITLESATSGFRADMADPRKFYRLIYP